MKTAIYITSDGRKIAYNLYGIPGESSVVFFHGLGALRNSIVVDEGWLKERQWAVISFDRTGTAPTGPRFGYSLERVADDAAALIQALGCAHCAAMGYSAGGLFAMAFAAHYPGLVDRLILVNPAPLYGSRRYHAKLGPGMRLAAIAARFSPALSRWAFTILSSQPGLANAFCDVVALARPFPFTPGEIRQPVHLWQADTGRAFPPTNVERDPGYIVMVIKKLNNE